MSVGDLLSRRVPPLFKRCERSKGYYGSVILRYGQCVRGLDDLYVPLTDYFWSIFSQPGFIVVSVILRDFSAWLYI